MRGLLVGHIVNVNTDRITFDGSLEEVHPVTGGGHGNKPVGLVSEVTCNKKFDRCAVVFKNAAPVKMRDAPRRAGDGECGDGAHAPTVSTVFTASAIGWPCSQQFPRVRRVRIRE